MLMRTDGKSNFYNLFSDLSWTIGEPELKPVGPFMKFVFSDEGLASCHRPPLGNVRNMAWSTSLYLWWDPVLPRWSYCIPAALKSLLCAMSRGIFLKVRYHHAILLYSNCNRLYTNSRNKSKFLFKAFKVLLMKEVTTVSVPSLPYLFPPAPWTSALETLNVQTLFLQPDVSFPHLSSELLNVNGHPL